MCIRLVASPAPSKSQVARVIRIILLNVGEAPGPYDGHLTFRSVRTITGDLDARWARVTMPSLNSSSHAPSAKSDPMPLRNGEMLGVGHEGLLKVIRPYTVYTYSYDCNLTRQPTKGLSLEQAARGGAC